MQSCSTKCMKALLIGFNGLLLIFAIVTISEASIDIAKIKEYLGNDHSQIKLDTVIIVIGSFIFLLAALGVYGAWKENSKLLYIYAGILTVIIILQLAFTIAVAADLKGVHNSAKERIRADFVTMKNSLHPNGDFDWDNYQASFKCCGVTGPADYGIVRRIRSSCCPQFEMIEANKTLSANAKDLIYSSECRDIVPPRYYTQGCEEHILEEINTAGTMLSVLGIVFSLMELAGVVFAIMLARAITKSNPLKGAPSSPDVTPHPSSAVNKA